MCLNEEYFQNCAALETVDCEKQDDDDIDHLKQNTAIKTGNNKNDNKPVRNRTLGLELCQSDDSES